MPSTVPGDNPNINIMLQSSAFVKGHVSGIDEVWRKEAGGG